MKFHILTLFPEMLENGLNTSIIGRGIEKGVISIHPIDIREFTANKHKKVDDAPYGGGAGMLMQAQPIFDAHLELTKSKSKTIRTIYLTPQGKVFTQNMAEEYAKEEELIFLCGHYEGIDERVLEEIVTDYVSIGDYVLTGGELPTMVMIDTISRLVPGVLKNDLSAQTETFQKHLLEYPQYSRPEIWHDKSVPQVLLSVNHKKIEEWRLEQSILKTKERRPDLYKRYEDEERAISWLMKEKLLHMDMIELMKRGQAELLDQSNDGILLRDKLSGTYMLSVSNIECGQNMLSRLPYCAENYLFVTHQDYMNAVILEKYQLKNVSKCYQVVYTRKETLPIDKVLKQQGFHMEQLGMEYLDIVTKNYQTMSSLEYIEERIQSKAVYGGFLGEKLVGFIGLHIEGSIGMLTVFEAERRNGIGLAMEANLINRVLKYGWVPYAQCFTDNVISLSLQQKLNLAVSKKKLYWIS